jgi:class 3 adenylate cyclase/tetratricopeptide (TPR) repeat protein
MQCPACQSSNRPNARFCVGCGRPLLSASAVEQGDERPRYCDICGARLVEGVPHSHQDGGMYALPSLDLETERKHVTVFFADIADSTRLIAGRDPEEAQLLLDPILQLMVDAARLYGGTVCQIQGDGIMTLFGAPNYFEDHALRACYAALSMHEKIARVALPEGSSPVALRIGIASGSVLVGVTGSELTLGYNATGEVIHLASRLQHMAPSAGTYCSAETTRLTAGLVETCSPGAMRIRGLEQDVEVFELLGTKPVANRFRARTTRGLTPFVGRDREYETLASALRAAAEGGGQAICVVGDAGAGKSRLLYEFLRSPAVETWLVLEASGMEIGKGTPLLPAIELMRAYFGIAELDGPGVAAERIAAQLRSLDIDWNECGPASLTLCGLAVSDPAWQAMAGPDRRLATTRTFTRLLRKRSEFEPLVVVMEDLQWIDGETRTLLEDLIGNLAGTRLAVITDCRLDYDTSWLSSLPITWVTIGSLSDDNAERLVQALLGNDGSVRLLRRELVRRTEGNPFFLEESIRELIDSKLLIGEPGHFRLTDYPATYRMPASVRAVLGSRVDRLASADKHLLQTAAAIGFSFPLTLLSEMLEGERPHDLKQRLARVSATGLVRETGLYPQIRFSFGHALTRDVVYEGMPLERRRLLHGRIVAAIEAIHADNLKEQVETLAYHAAHAGLWEKAAYFGEQAGQKAAAQSAYAEAVAHFEEALAALDRQEPSAAVMTRAIDMRFKLRNSLFPLGKIAEDLAHMRRADGIAGELGDKERHAWVSAYISRDLSLLGDPEQSLQKGLHAFRLASELGGDELRALVMSYIGQAHYALGNYGESARIMEEQIRVIPVNAVSLHFGLPGSAAIFFRCWLVWALTRLGTFDEGLAKCAEVMQIATRLDQPLGITVATYSHGKLLVGRGDFATAIPVLESAMSSCRSWGFGAWLPNIEASLGRAYACTGQPGAGQELIRQAIMHMHAIRILVHTGEKEAWLAEALLAGGDVTGAHARALEAVKLSQTHSERGNEAEALRILGEIGLRMPDFDRDATAATLEAALSLATACEMRPLMMQCHDAFARLHQRAGDEGSAEAHRSKAAALAGEMGVVTDARAVA